MNKILQKLKPFCLVLVLVFMVWGLYALRGQLGNAFKTADWRYLGAAGFIATVYLLLNASVWGLIIRVVKTHDAPSNQTTQAPQATHPSRMQAAFLWIECETMRWLPGGIWGYASRVVQAKRIGLNKTNAAFSLAHELALTVSSWALLGLLGAAFSPRLRSVALIYLERIKVPPTLFVVTLVGLALLGLALVLTNTLGLRDKFLTATTPIRQGLRNWRTSLRALSEYLVLNLFYSAGFLLCLKGIGVDPAPSLIEAAGAYGLAWIVGFVAFGAPGGMGVREGFLFLVFQPLGIGTQVATAAILWRAIQILTEILTFLVIKLKKLSPQ